MNKSIYCGIAIFLCCMQCNCFGAEHSDTDFSDVSDDSVVVKVVQPAVELTGFDEILSPRHASVFACDLAKLFGLAPAETDELKSALSGIRRAKSRTSQRENLTKILDICGLINHGTVDIEQVAGFMAEHITGGKNPLLKPAIERNIGRILKNDPRHVQYRHPVECREEEKQLNLVDLERREEKKRQDLERREQKKEQGMTELLAIVEQARAHDTLNASKGRWQKVAAGLGTLAGAAALAFLTKLMTDFSLGGDCECSCGSM